MATVQDIGCVQRGNSLGYRLFRAAAGGGGGGGVVVLLVLLASASVLVLSRDGVRGHDYRLIHSTDKK